MKTSGQPKKEGGGEHLLRTEEKKEKSASYLPLAMHRRHKRTYWGWKSEGGRQRHLHFNLKFTEGAEGLAIIQRGEAVEGGIKTGFVIFLTDGAQVSQGLKN